MVRLLYNGSVSESGELRTSQAQLMSAELKRLSGKRVRIIVEEVEPRATEAQRAAFVGFIVPEMKKAFHDIGNMWSDQQVYDYLMAEFFVEKLPGEPDKYLSWGESGGISKRVFSEKLREIQIFAAEYLSYNLQDPRRR